MNIYEIGQDFDNYKFFVFKEEDKSNKDVWDYNGQSLVNEWKGLSLELFKDKRKKKDKRSEDFDASCYFSGCLIVNKRTSLLLAEKLKGQIEVLPVNVDGNTSNYYFTVLPKNKPVTDFAPSCISLRFICVKFSPEEIMSSIKNTSRSLK